MKFCPDCRTEYTDAGIFCSRCNVLLVDALPAPLPMNECDHCGGEVDLDSDFCPHCGTLSAEDQYSCTNHPIAVATGVCVVCQKLFCAECLTERSRRLYCPEHADVETREGWTMVFSTSDFYEAEIIRGRLENGGITVASTNSMNIGLLAEGFMDNSLGRTIFKYPIKVFVPAHQFEEAQRILSEENSIDEEQN